MSTQNEFPVSELPYISSLNEVGYADRKRFGLNMPSGHMNDYRVERMKGRGASSSDRTWNRTEKTHSCCGSKAWWRHKVACPLLLFEDEK